MKPIRKSVAIAKPGSKGVNKTQIHATLSDPADALADTPHSISPTTIHQNEITLAKKSNYFSLKLQQQHQQNKPASAAKFSLHQRHFSVSQPSTAKTVDSASGLNTSMYHSFSPQGGRLFRSF